MPFDLKAEIEATKQEFRQRRRQQWKLQYAKDHHLTRYDSKCFCNVPDPSRAPEPPWDCYSDPEFVAVQWGTGFMIITAEAFAKIPRSKLKLLIPKRR